MNEEIEMMPSEEVSEDNAMELDRLREENETLRRSLICARLGVPENMAEDIICLAKRGIDGGIAEEEAIAEAFGRMRRCGSLTTGIRSEKGGVRDDTLRRAFGLK